MDPKIELFLTCNYAVNNLLLILIFLGTKSIHFKQYI